MGVNVDVNLLDYGTADITRLDEFSKRLAQLLHDLLDKGAPLEKLKIYITQRVKDILAPHASSCLVGGYHLPIVVRTEFPKKEREDGYWESDIVIGYQEEWNGEEWVDV